MVDEHEWVLEEGVNAGRCAHDALTGEERSKPWLKKESSAHKALTKIVWIPAFLTRLGITPTSGINRFICLFDPLALLAMPQMHPVLVVPASYVR